MYTQTLLVTGRYGFVGQIRSSIGNYNVDLSMQFSNIWVLRHDGTPTGFRQAWVNAQADCAKSIVQNLCIKPPLRLADAENYALAHPVIYIGDARNGIVAQYFFLSVVQDFGVQA